MHGAQASCGAGQHRDGGMLPADSPWLTSTPAVPTLCVRPPSSKEGSQCSYTCEMTKSLEETRNQRQGGPLAWSLVADRRGETDLASKDTPAPSETFTTHMHHLSPKKHSRTSCLYISRSLTHTV